MIKKIISCADIHIPSLKGIDELKGVLGNFIAESKKIVDETGKDECRIVVLGDVFNSKISITNESILTAGWFFSELDKICKTYVIAGNHDFLMNNMDRVDSLSPLFEIGKYDNVIYLDKNNGYKSGCFVDDNIVWCLYSSFDNFSNQDIVANKELYTDKTMVGLIHADINGASTATNYVIKEGINGRMFDGLDFVIAGHIHKFQEINENGIPIVYCSSIKQHNYGESVSMHGFVLWTKKDKYDYEFISIENNDGGYYKFSINNIDDIENDNEELVNA